MPVRSSVGVGELAAHRRPLRLKDTLIANSLRSTVGGILKHRGILRLPRLSANKSLLGGAAKGRGSDLTKHRLEGAAWDSAGPLKYLAKSHRLVLLYQGTHLHVAIVLAVNDALPCIDLRLLSRIPPRCRILARAVHAEASRCAKGRSRLHGSTHKVCHHFRGGPVCLR